MKINNQLINIEKKDHFYILTLNRSEKRNALNHSMRRELIDFFSIEDLHNQVVILTGNGTAFCAGMDLKEIKFESGATDFMDLVAAIYNCNCITIAAVNGATRGGGLMIVNACDFAIASEDSSFGMPDINAGKEDAFTKPEVKKAIKERTKGYETLAGKVLNPEEALQRGFVNEKTTHDSLLERAIDLANEIKLKKNEAAIKSYTNQKSARHFENKPRNKAEGLVKHLA